MEIFYFTRRYTLLVKVDAAMLWVLVQASVLVAERLIHPFVS